MYVILPVAGTNARQFQQRLSSGAWESRLARFEEVEGTIQIPRFKLDCGAQLERALKINPNYSDARKALSELRG